MLFADVSLAARIERADARLIADSSANVARRTGGDGAFVTPIAGGVAAFTAPGSKSQQNAQARGSELLYSRAVLVREP